MWPGNTDRNRPVLSPEGLDRQTAADLLGFILTGRIPPTPERCAAVLAAVRVLERL